MQFVAYYANEDDSKGLRERFLLRLAVFLPDTSLYELEYARCASRILYLRIIRHHPKCSIAALVERFREVSNENPVLQFHYKPECSDVFELRKQAGFWAFIPFARCPIIDRVLFVSVVPANTRIRVEYFLVHGSNFIAELVFKWRGGQDFLELDPIPEDRLIEQGIFHLVAEPQTVALPKPLMHQSPGVICYLECWRRTGGPMGKPIRIETSELSIPTRGDSPPSQSEDSKKYDIFISHAGPIKHLARDLENDLHNLRLRAFVDVTALHPGDRADKKILDSARKAPVGLVLFDNNFLLRHWPMAELKLIIEEDTLLPVIIGMSHAEFEAAWRASEVASQLDDAFFEHVIKRLSSWTKEAGKGNCDKGSALL